MRVDGMSVSDDAAEAVCDGVREESKKCPYLRPCPGGKNWPRAFSRVAVSCTVPRAFAFRLGRMERMEGVLGNVRRRLPRTHTKLRKRRH